MPVESRRSAVQARLDKQQAQIRRKAEQNSRPTGRIPKREPESVAAAITPTAPAKRPPVKREVKKKRPGSIIGQTIQKDLSDNETIRKAMVLREVLGPPLALRQ